MRFYSHAKRGIAAAQLIAVLSVAALGQVCPQGQAVATDEILKEASKFPDVRSKSVVYKLDTAPPSTPTSLPAKAARRMHVLQMQMHAPPRCCTSGRGALWSERMAKGLGLDSHACNLLNRCWTCS